MGKNIYFICEKSDINYIEELSEIFRNNGYSVFIFLANNFNEAHNDLIKASQVIFCISPQTGENVYNLANERFDLRKISINLFVKPTDLTATQRQIIGKNKSIFFSLNSDDKEIYKEIIEVLNSGYDWSLFPLPVYEEPKKSNVGIIIGIVAALIIMAGGIAGYYFYVQSAEPKEYKLIRDFNERLLSFITNNDISLASHLYPALNLNDSLNKNIFNNDFEISILESPDSYKITYNPDINYIIRRDGDNFIIVDSHGLLAFPEDKLEISKKTGLWDSSLSDIELSKRIHDDKFFEYLGKRYQGNLDKVLNINPTLYPINNLGEGFFEIINNSNLNISGNVYSIKLKRSRPIINPNSDEIITNVEYEDIGGIDLEPNSKGEIKVEYYVMGHGEDLEIEKIEWITLPINLINNYITFSGNEYQEYLSNGGEVLTQTTAHQLPTFIYDDYTYTLNPDGNITCTNTDLYGEYKKIGDGKLYKVVTRSYTGDGAIYLLIVDNYVYLIDAGSTTVITDFTYDPSSNNVTFTKMDYHDISSEDADYLRAERNIKSLVNPLTHFEKVGTVKYN